MELVQSPMNWIRCTFIALKSGHLSYMDQIKCKQDISITEISMWSDSVHTIHELCHLSHFQPVSIGHKNYMTM